MMVREDVPRVVQQLVGRPARWATPRLSLGSYDGCERTLEIFDAEGNEQLGLLRRLRSTRPDLERAAGGSIVFVFHTPGETRRLYPDVFIAGRPRPARYADLAAAFTRWLAEDHQGQLSVEPDEIERFTFEPSKAA
jgi:hypothetical protein